MESENFNSLVQLCGIETQYIDSWGKPSQISTASQMKLLSAMGVDTSTPTALDEAMANEIEDSWLSPLPPVVVIRDEEHLVLPLAVPIKWCNDKLTVVLTTEQGAVYSETLYPVDGQLIDVWQDGDIEFHKYLLCLNSVSMNELPFGYHTISLNSTNINTHCRLIKAPKQCYKPDYITDGGKSWGFSIQLYSLRSEHNWGVGDFHDLAVLAKAAAQLGADFIGLNPIHALFPANPDSCSPYGPSSRQWLNFIYIDVCQVPGYDDESVQQLIAQPSFQSEITRLRSLEYIDYQGVAALKLQVLQQLFTLYSTCYLTKNTKQNKAFKTFIAQGGHSLLVQTAYDALQAHFKANGNAYTGWHNFPETFQDFNSPAVQSFIKKQAKQVQFYQFLQWQATLQLESAQQVALKAGMKIGLYRDLAVGVSENSAEVWGNSTLYCSSVSIGAPPDVLGPLGQNWGLPPMHPNELYQQAYQPIIDVFASNMSASGALRIDHVMALLRLWWVPKGNSPTDGGYVYYPVDDLLAIVALESHRNKSLVIGEDLGTVPSEIRTKLAESGIHSYKVFLFEQAPDGGYFSPAHYPEQSMAAITTHDMPTLIGYWHCLDFELGSQIGVYPDASTLQQLYQDRHRQKQALLDTLHGHGSIDDSVSRDVNVTAMTETLCHGMHTHLANGASALISFQLEDWLQMDKPVNIPGTFNEYPNWRRKLTKPIEHIFADPKLVELAKQITYKRGRAVEQA